MTRAAILTGGAIALTLLAVVCIPRHLSPPPSASVAPATFHARLEQGTLTLRGSLPSERSKTAILQQVRTISAQTSVRVTDELVVDSRVESAAWVDTVPKILPALGLMADRGSIIIDGHSLVLSGRAGSEQVKTTIARTVAPALQTGLEIEDHVLATTSAPSPAKTASETVSLPTLQSSLNHMLSKSSIEFESNSATVTVRGQTALDRIVALLRESPKASIEIAGHTDSFGAVDYNMQLSRRRADAVKQYFITRGLTNPFTTIGYGATRPLSNAKHQTGLQQNRRIELRVKGPGDL